MLLVVVEGELYVLDDGLGREGGSGDGIHLQILGVFHALAVPHLLEGILYLDIVLGALERLEELDLLDLVLLDVDLQRGGTGIALDVLTDGGGVDDGHAVFLGHRFIASDET